MTITAAEILLEYKKIKGTGEKAQRHTDTFITPNAVAASAKPDAKAKSPLRLGKATTDTKGKPVPSGARLFPIKGTHRVDPDGQHVSHFHAVHDDGSVSRVEVKHAHIQTETEKTGKHSDEHGVIKTWNHFSKHSKDGNVPSVEDMHSEIEKAKKDPKHPLHISHAKKSEFTHGVNGIDDGATDAVKKRAEDSYYKNLKDAAHTVHAMANHKDFKGHWKNKDELDTAGRTRPELSDLYKKSGVRGAGATSKGDAITVKTKDKKGGYKGIKSISLKQGDGSQLMSSSPAEFHAIYSHALRKIHGHDGKSPMSRAHAEHQKVVNAIKGHLENGDHETAHKKLTELHDKLDKKGLNRAVHREAITGEGKFKTQEGTATHVVTIGKKAKVQSVDEFMHDHEPYFSRPRATKGKHGEETTAVRLDTPKIPAKVQKERDAADEKNVKTKLVKKAVATVRDKVMAKMKKK